MTYRRIDGDKILIDVARDGRKTSVSLPASIFFLDAKTREGGAKESAAVVRDLADKGKNSAAIVAALGYRAIYGTERLMAAYEAKTGESALKVISGQQIREGLVHAIRLLSDSLSDEDIHSKA